MEHNRRKHAGQADVDRELCPAEYLGGGVDPEVVNAANGVTPNGDVYGNLVGGGFQITRASTSTRAFWARYRLIAAQARARLVAAASETWGVPPTEVEIVSGLVSHSSGKRAMFADLAPIADKTPIPDGGLHYSSGKNDPAAEALQIAKALDWRYPIKVQSSREEEFKRAVASV